MTEIVLHIGPHKTGTTAIQEFLSCHHDRLLAESGIDFPQLGRRPRGTLGSQAHRHFSAYMRGAEHEYPADFVPACAGGISTAPVCILSSEDFYFGSETEQIERLFALVPGITRVVVFLRDPVAHVCSMYGEALKGRFTRGLTGFVDHHLDRLRAPRGKFSYYRYEENIARWSTFAPVTEVTHDPTHDVLQDFFAAAVPGFDPGPLGAGPGRLNVAAPPLTKALQHSLNRSVETGRLDEAGYQALKKRLSRRGSGDLEPLYGGRLIEVATPTRRFAKVFRRLNPRLAWLGERSAREVTSWELPEALDAAVIADMKP